MADNEIKYITPYESYVAGVNGMMVAWETMMDNCMEDLYMNEIDNDNIINGLHMAGGILHDIRQKIIDNNDENKIKLVVMLVGHDRASEKYVNNKRAKCMYVGIECDIHYFDTDVTSNELLTHIDEINNDENVHGLIVQLPLPEHISEQLIMKRINPLIDVDGFNPSNIGMLTGKFDDIHIPCTPQGIMMMIESIHGPDLSGLNCCVVGRSHIVGEPVSRLLLSRNGTVTICHSRTNDLSYHTKNADIIVCSVGQAGLITTDMVKPGATVIDVGINIDNDGKLCGDVDFENVKNIAGYITPVPGGVGPMTVAMLIKNTVDSYYRMGI